jgi:hypothetical protein
MGIHSTIDLLVLTNSAIFYTDFVFFLTKTGYCKKVVERTVPSPEVRVPCSSSLPCGITIVKILIEQAPRIAITRKFPNSLEPIS